MTRDEALQLSVPFGKFKGQKLEKVLTSEPEYVTWLLSLDDIKSDRFKEALAALSETENAEAETPPAF